MKRLFLLSLVVMSTACTQDMDMTSDLPSAGYPMPRNEVECRTRPPFGTYPPCYQRQDPRYPRQSSRQSDPLNDASRQSRSARTIVQNITGIFRDLSR